MIQENDGDAGKTVWVWRFLLWSENDPEVRMKNFSISWYDKYREKSIWQVDITFWPPLQEGHYYV